ncbi:MAG TPA: M6 family metalloprotease domain-containing protein [candidate division Zixibacteria bacterium]|nr:M6 family metalloprotease domain-containing protein [candidate division Zixibacteria bacterium]
MKLISLMVCAFVALTVSALAVGPHPELQSKITSGEVERPPFLTNLEENRAKGMCSADTHSAIKRVLSQARPLFSSPGDPQPAPTVTFKALAVLVDFSDKVSSVNAQFFDTLLFTAQSGTVRDYYSEISYGQLDLVSLNLPSTLGWKRAPQTYAYYVNGQNGTGAYPNNTQKLTEDVVDLINPLVDFSQYDNDGDGKVDVLVIVHAGSGAEYTGSANDIWSHKWAISPRAVDGVSVSDFTVQPEYWASGGDMTIGVYAHELGHGFGLPDLYDTDNTSWGIGRWSLMASGSWNGATGFGESPAHPDAWSRIQMGLASATNVTSNTTGSLIPSVESGSNIFRLWTGGGASVEYFLVENRQKTGYDTYIPGSGLLIWHIDDGETNNRNEWYPGHTASGNLLVALEQADGLWNLEKKVDVGSAGDPFALGFGFTTFSGATTPNSDSYAGIPTFVAVSNISASAPLMTADFTVSLSAGVGDEEPALPTTLVVNQNYPNPFNPSTVISFYTPKTSQVTVTVYNTLGQEVVIVADGILPPGAHEVKWDGRDRDGRSLASGIYFYEVETEDDRETRKMALIK